MIAGNWVIVRPHQQSWPNVAADQSFFRSVYPLGYFGSERLTVGHLRPLDWTLCRDEG